MTVRHSIVAALLDLAGWLAPSHDRMWADAMRAETAALADDREALRWAFGCLGAALVWRCKRESPYAVTLATALLVLPLASEALTTDWMRHARPSTGQEIGDATSVFNFGLAAVAAGALALARRRRWLVSTLAVGLLGQWETLLFFGLRMPNQTLADPLGGAAANHPHLPNGVLVVFFLGMFIGPGLLGAAAGGLTGHLVSRIAFHARRA